MSVADVYTVIGHYLQNRDLIDQYLFRRKSEAAELRDEIERTHPTAGLRQRLARHRDGQNARAAVP